MHITRQTRRQMADRQKEWERNVRPTFPEGEIRHNDWLWEKPISRSTLNALQALSEDPHHGTFGMIVGLQLKGHPARVVPDSLPLPRRIVGPQPQHYALMVGDRRVRTTANPIVAWKWLALKAGLSI